MIVQTEQLVSLPVINPDTGGMSRSFRYFGKFDRHEGRKVVDWKSAKDPQRFLRQKSIGFQVELYALACEAAGYPVDEVEYRIIAVPSIKFCGKDKGFASVYEQRCFEWLTDDPARMVEHSRPVNAARLEQARHYLWSCSKRILEARRTGRWLPNESACYTWERECEYMPLCQCLAEGGDVDAVQAERYQRVEDTHPELGVTTDRDILTYSSMGVLTLCELKYHWRHEQRLRVQHEDSAESLWLGSAMHHGLQAFAAGGVEAAQQAIAEWADANPVIGPDAAHKQEQEAAKARAMVRAAAKRWSI